MPGDTSHPRFTLRSLDLLGSDAELREQAEAALRQRDANQPSGVHTGQDPTGSVTVFLGDDGQVRDVTVAREWSRRVGVADLGEALFAAYRAAMRSTLEAAALTELEHEPAPAEPAAPTPRRHRPAPDEAADQEWLRRVWETLESNDSALTALSRQPESAGAEETAVSPYGSLTARHRAGSIVAITGAPELIAELDAGQLQYEAHALLRSCGEIRSRNRS